MDRAEIEAEILALEEADDYARCEVDLGAFIRSAWPVLEPGTPYLHNWHIDAIADHLEAVRLGQIRKLIINMPPRNMKSISVTVCFPVWLWLRDPAKRFICTSYSARLSTKHNLDRRQLIESDWFQRGWRSRFKIMGDQNQKTMFQNDHRGQMFSTSVGGSVTGEGADILIWDDPINPKLAASDVTREKANEWRDKTLSSRLNNKKTGVEIGVMQRLHEDDVAGHVLKKKDGEPWSVLCLEGKATKKHTVVFPVSGRKVVREEGDFLHPEREGAKEHAQSFADLGSAGYQSQIQQDPTPIAGGFFHRRWWKYFKEKPMSVRRIIQIWDCAEEPGVSNDYSVCATWAETATGYYRIGLLREKMAFPQLKQAALSQAELHRPHVIVIEKKSAGTQLIQTLEAETSLPIERVVPRLSKVVRAGGAQPGVEAGNYYLPQGDPANEAFIKEHEKFPNGDNDDQVDTTSMLAEYVRRAGVGPRIR